MQRDILKIMIRITKILILTTIVIGISSCGQLFNSASVTSSAYSHPTFAPDGRIVAQKYEKYSDGSTRFWIVIMDQDGKNERTICAVEDGVSFIIQVSPSLNYLLADNVVYSMKTGNKLYKGTMGVCTDWSPDETMIASAQGDPMTLRIYNAQTGEMERDLGLKVKQKLCWKYKSKIAFVMDDAENYPNVGLCFVNPDGSGLVTTNISFFPESYDKDLDYVYDWRGGFVKVDTNSLVRTVEYSYTWPYDWVNPRNNVTIGLYASAISPDGKTIMLVSDPTYQFGISLLGADASNFREIKQ